MTFPTGILPPSSFSLQARSTCTAHNHMINPVEGLSHKQSFFPADINLPYLASFHPVPQSWKPPLSSASLPLFWSQSQDHGSSMQQVEADAEKISIEITSTEGEKKEVLQPSDRDVICTKCTMAGKHPGNIFYSRLVAERQLVLEAQRGNPTPLEIIDAAKEIVRMIRQRGGNFLFKFKRNVAFYDIGDKQAIRKTFLLLGKSTDQGEREEEDYVEENELTPEVLARLKEISRSRNSSNQTVTEVMELLVIPPEIDPIEWEQHLQRKRSSRPHSSRCGALNTEEMIKSSNDVFDSSAHGSSDEARREPVLKRRSLPIGENVEHPMPRFKRKRYNSLPPRTGVRLRKRDSFEISSQERVPEIVQSL